MLNQLPRLNIGGVAADLLEELKASLLNGMETVIKEHSAPSKYRKTDEWNKRMVVSDFCTLLHLLSIFTSSIRSEIRTQHRRLTIREGRDDHTLALTFRMSPFWKLSSSHSVALKLYSASASIRHGTTEVRTMDGVNTRREKE